MKVLIQLIVLISMMISQGIMQDKSKNLQVLDFESERDLKKYMKSVSKDLGVKCKYCHDLNDKSIDTDHKKIAREMMRMQMNLNKSFFAHLGDSLHIHGDMPQISCWTCHRGTHEAQTARPKE